MATSADFEALLGVPVTVTSGYRDPKKNALVGGAKRSDHLTDSARDIVPKGMSMADAAKRLKASGKYTKVINEGDHVHVSYDTGNKVAISDDDLINALTGKGPAPAAAVASGGLSDDALLKALTSGSNEKKAAPAAPSAPSKPPRGQTLADVIRAIPGGLVKGGAAVLGLPGDINALMDAGANMLTGANISTRSLPTGEEIGNTVAAPFGGFYQPQTTAGEYADTIAQFAAAAIAPGNALLKAARVVVPGAASEAAGQATEGTPYELPARVGGALLGAGAVGGARSLTAPKQEIPTVQDLKAASQAAYKAADEAGVIIKKQAIKELGADIKAAVAEAGIDATLHPKAMAAVKRVLDTKGNVTLKGMEILRRVANGAAGSMDKDEARIARIILDRIDDFVENLGTERVLSGNAEAASKALTDARTLWAKSAKGKEIETLFERAKNRAETIGGSGYENALRVEFRQLAQNPKRMRRFSQVEQDAIKDVARGGAIQNFARMVGKVSPTSGVIPSLGSIGAVAYDPVGGLILPAVGMTGKGLSTAATIKNAERALNTVRLGAAPAKGPAITPELLSALLARKAQEDGGKANAFMPIPVGAR